LTLRYVLCETVLPARLGAAPRNCSSSNLIIQLPILTRCLSDQIAIITIRSNVLDLMFPFQALRDSQVDYPVRAERFEFEDAGT